MTIKNKFLSKHITAVSVSILILSYAVICFWLKTDGWDFSKAGFSFLFEEMKNYIAAIGVVWSTYLLSIDRAKKEIYDEAEKLFKKDVRRIFNAVVQDSIDVILAYISKMGGFISEKRTADNVIQIMNKTHYPIRPYGYLSKIRSILQQIKNEVTAINNDSLIPEEFMRRQEGAQKELMDWTNKGIALMDEAGIPKDDRHDPDLSQLFIEMNEDMENKLP